MKAEIITIGTELLRGDMADTNSLFLAEGLARLGVDLMFKTTVGDDEGRIEAVLRDALKRSNLIVITGGLGPTEDDVTKKVVSRTLGRRLIFREDLRDKMSRRYASLQRQVPKSLDKQAVVPAGAIIVENPIGTAPGLILEHPKGHVMALPGVPQEMTAMFQETVFDFIRNLLGGYGVIRLRVLRSFGLMESKVNDMISDLMGTDKEPYIGLTAKETGVDIRLNAFGKDERAAETLIRSAEGKVRSRLEDAIYGVDEETMEGVVGGLLIKQGFRIAIAESCTGGLIGHRLTEVPGSSVYFERGVICYSNAAKSDLLQIQPESIEKHGAVSSMTAAAMAEGVRANGGTDLGLAVTGIAGPGGGSAEKPVGLIYIALASAAGTSCEERHLTGTRQAIKLRASQHALDMVRRYLLRGADAEHRGQRWY